MSIYDQFLYGLLAAVVSGLFAALIAIIPKGINFLKTKAQAIKDENLRKAVDSALSGLEIVVNTVVTSLQQTIVGNLKQASKDGKLTAEQIKSIKGKAINDINTILSDEMKDILSKNYGNLDYFIEHLIEEAVFNLKNQQQNKEEVKPDNKQ